MEIEVWVESSAIMLYSVTFVAGLAGNTWLALSLWRSRPLNNGSLSPRSGGGATGLGRSRSICRVRRYTSALALVDLLVMVALFVRICYATIPINAWLSATSLRFIYAFDGVTKAASLGCLTLISTERLAIIKLPLVTARIAPIGTLSQQLSRLNLFARKGTFGILLFAVLLLSLSAILLQAMTFDVGAMQEHVMGVFVTPERVTLPFGSGLLNFANWLRASIFLLLIAAVSVNYSLILLHIRRQLCRRHRLFITRQLRRFSAALAHPVVIHQRVLAGALKPSTFSLSSAKSGDSIHGDGGSRYTCAARLVLIHAALWLPYCVLQVLVASGVLHGATLRVENIATDGYNCVEWAWTLAGWLPYASSATNWILYAVMNRELCSQMSENAARRMAHHGRSTLPTLTTPVTPVSTPLNSPRLFPAIHYQTTKIRNDGKLVRSNGDGAIFWPCTAVTGVSV